MPRKQEQSLEERLQAKEWRALPQNVALGNDTKSAKRRRKLDVLKLLCAVTLFGGLAALFAYVWRDMMHEITAPEEALPVTLEFVNDGGVLDEAWCRERTGFDENSLPNLNEMRRRLVSYPQVSDARVSRVVGGIVRVELRERRPIARLAGAGTSAGTDLALDADGDGNAAPTRLVASDGVIFPAETFPATQSMLPLLTDVKIIPAGEEGSAFDRVVGLAPLVDFIDLARERYKKIFADWESISLKDFPTDSRELSQPWSVLRVTPRATAHNPAQVQIVEIVFSASQFREDLKLLAAAEADGKLDAALEAAAGTGGAKTYRILFITNKKTPGNEFREMRVIPVDFAPAGTSAGTKRAGTATR